LAQGRYGPRCTSLALPPRRCAAPRRHGGRFTAPGHLFTDNSFDVDYYAATPKQNADRCALLAPP